MVEEKKLTDEEIVKALEVCANDRNCKECPYTIKGIDCCVNQRSEKDYLDLIHRLQSEYTGLKERYVKVLGLNEKVIAEQQAEIERLKDEKEEIRLFNLAIQNGEIDMRIESEMAKSFYHSIVQIFEQNGATNFFTTTIDIEGKKGRYAFTIEKVGGQTVAEKLAEQKAEIERLTKWKDKLQDTKDELEQQLIDTGFKEYCEENKRLTDENAELQKQVDELEQLLLITKTNKSIEQKKTVKEYAEKLKLRLFEYTDNDVSYDEFCKANVVCGEIDDICKEQYGVEVEDE